MVDFTATVAATSAVKKERSVMAAGWEESRIGTRLGRAYCMQSMHPLGVGRSVSTVWSL